MINEKTKCELWYENLSSNDINLVNKLEDLCEIEISKELVELINLNKDKYYPRIESYIKKRIPDYICYIKSKTSELWSKGITNDICDYSSGLYNCNKLYIEAIVNAIGFIKLVN